HVCTSHDASGCSHWVFCPVSNNVGRTINSVLCLVYHNLVSIGCFSIRLFIFVISTSFSRWSTSPRAKNTHPDSTLSNLNGNIWLNDTNYLLALTVFNV